MVKKLISQDEVNNSILNLYKTLEKQMINPQDPVILGKLWVLDLLYFKINKEIIPIK